MLEVRTTATMGRGVFATRALAPGESLGTFHALGLPPAEVAAVRGGVLSQFWFEDDADGSAYVVFGVIELVNHRRPANVDRRWLLVDGTYVVEMFALTAIAAGEQLFLDYKFTGHSDDPAWAR